VAERLRQALEHVQEALALRPEAQDLVDDSAQPPVAHGWIVGRGRDPGDEVVLPR